MYKYIEWELHLVFVVKQWTVVVNIKVELVQKMMRAGEIIIVPKLFRVR